MQWGAKEKSLWWWLRSQFSLIPNATYPLTCSFYPKYIIYCTACTCSISDTPTPQTAAALTFCNFCSIKTLFSDSLLQLSTNWPAQPAKLHHRNVQEHIGQSVKPFSFGLNRWWLHLSSSYLVVSCVQNQATATALSVWVFNGTLKCFLFLCRLIMIFCVSSMNGWWWLCKCAIGEWLG